MSDPPRFQRQCRARPGSSAVSAPKRSSFGERGAKCWSLRRRPGGKNKADAKNVAQILGDPLVIECDVTNPPRVESMMMEIGDKADALDVLVNNSGIIRTAPSRK